MSHKLYGILDSCCKYPFSGKKKGGRDQLYKNIKYSNYNILWNYKMLPLKNITIWYPEFHHNEGKA